MGLHFLGALIGPYKSDTQMAKSGLQTLWKGNLNVFLQHLLPLLGLSTSPSMTLRSVIKCVYVCVFLKLLIGLSNVC